MPRTEDGEFELVLGNKQMLSVFFIMVILLGVFFTMGYIFGRNSAPVAAVDRGQTAATVSPSERGEGPSAMPANPPAQAAPQAGEQENTAATDTGPTGAAATENAPPQEAPATPQAASGSPSVISPEAGQTFVQVSSMLERPAAEILVDVLSKKDFHAVIAPGPNDRFRVLVGPVKDSTEAGRVRGDLEQAGFKGAFVKRY